VASPFKLLEDQFVHAAAGINQRSGHNGERTTFFKYTGRGEQLLGNVERFDVNAARHGAAGVADPLVEGASHTSDRVHEQEDIVPHLDQALATLDCDLRQSHVAFDIAIEAAGQHFAINT